MIRENKDYIHQINFELNKEVLTEYYIKDFKNYLDIPIKTTNLIIKDNYLLIEYITLTNDNNYKYVLEVTK